MKYLVLVFFLFGCYTPKKADRQLDKVNDEYPEKIAALCTKEYPIKYKRDTVTEVYYDLIEVECPEYVQETVHDTITYRDTIFTKVIKTLPAKVVTITKTVEDSAKIKVLTHELITAKNGHEKHKQASNNKFMWILVAIIVGLVLYIIKKK